MLGRTHKEKVGSLREKKIRTSLDAMRSRQILLGSEWERVCLWQINCYSTSFLFRQMHRNSISSNNPQGRSQDFSKGGGGGHTEPNNIVMAFSPRNIVGCLLKKGLQRGGHGHPRTPPRYALDPG